MGCDGGSIPRRDELVKLKKKAEKVDPTEVERIKWFTCAMSNERLKEPIVACELGHLYNKEAVIRCLIDKNIDEKFKHIRNLKDLITPRLTPNPAFNASAATTDNSASRSPFLCPITLIEVGHAPFTIMRTCGCVLSERALREVPSATCLQCGTPVTPDDVITLNPDAEHSAELRTRMEMRRAQERGKKKEKREKRREKKEKETETAANGTHNGTHSGTHNGKEPSEKSEQDIPVQDKKGKKREVETTSAPVEPPAKSSKLSTGTTTSTAASSSSKTTTTTTTTTTTSATYTPAVAGHGAEKGGEEGQPSVFTVPKTTAYNSIFNSGRKGQTSNKLFSGIY